MSKWVAALDSERPTGSGSDQSFESRFGPRAALLRRMAELDLPVPPGFAVAAEACAALAVGDENAWSTIVQALEDLGRRTGRRLDDPAAPLLVAVQPAGLGQRGAARETILNLGLTQAVAEGLVASGSARLAWDARRRLIARYAEAVLGLDREPFDATLDLLIERRGHLEAEPLDSDLAIAAADATALLAEQGASVPDDAATQIRAGLLAVAGAGSVDGRPAGVVVQAMVFGNRDRASGTGRMFTRDPKTGEHAAHGEFVPGTQGADAFTGLRMSQPLTGTERRVLRAGGLSLEEAMPTTFASLMQAARRLEAAERDCLQITFVVEAGTVWLIGARPARRTGQAALQIAVDLVEEGLIAKTEAVARIDPRQLEPLLHPTLEIGGLTPEIARGLPASPGAAWGEIALTAAEAETLKAQGRPVILVRQETGPEDVRGMLAAEGILTRLGGMTSHAAVLARGWGKPCVSGASALRIDAAAGVLTIAGRAFKRGDVLTLDGGTGRVLLGRAPTREPALTGAFATLMGWADEIRRLNVRANAETATDAAAAVNLGAEGIGLCRTEHMFFEGGRIVPMREMILAGDAAGRRRALDRLLPMQRADFAALYRAVPGRPVTVRLLDPPLHEFLPQTEAEIAEVAEALGVSRAVLMARVSDLQEVNPMLGVRGCRLAILYPEILDMQVRAILEAAADVLAEDGLEATPEILVPIVATGSEIRRLAAQIRTTADEVVGQRGVTLRYTIGTMIELPRAALRAGELAREAAFFSFGTNDLTQTTWGISRDDSAPLLDAYLGQGVLATDPFVELDREGVGELIRLASERGRAVRGDLLLGLCGEHGGDPRSVAFCEELGLDYVSCAPRRVPIARLAAAQAVIARQSRPSVISRSPW